MTLAEKIQNWLDSSDQNTANQLSFANGALMLLQCNSNRYMYNSLLKSWRMPSSKRTLVVELRKHLRILLSGVTTAQIVQMQPKVDAIGEELEKTETSPSFRGKRPDHDALPSDIQAIYKEVDNIRMKMRSLHERLKSMRNAAPCDRHEYTLQLIDLDKRYHKQWERYDTWKPEDTKTDAVPSSIVQSVTEPQDAISTVSSCRSYISKNLSKLEELSKDPIRLSDYESLRMEITRRYKTAVSLGAEFKESYRQKLLSLGVQCYEGN